MKQGCAIHYDLRLVEEAVFHAQRDGYVRRDLDEQRSQIYEVADPEERERLFFNLNRAWFNKLGLDKVIEAALHEQPLIAAMIDDCFIVAAAEAKQESAELFVAQNDRRDHQKRTLRILLRPQSLLDPVSLMIFLRHELFHIADMLDPGFAYEPSLPKAPGGPIYDTIITNRYRVLWDVTINGRMARRGWLAATARGQQLNEFLGVFPMLAEQGDELFDRFYNAERPKHVELAAFALDPRTATGGLIQRSGPGMHCPLCKFPTHVYESEPGNLGNQVLQAITQDFPNWQASQGLCTQCADLYRAAGLSLAAAKQLPGWHTGLRSGEAKYPTRCSMAGRTEKENHAKL